MNEGYSIYPIGVIKGRLSLILCMFFGLAIFFFLVPWLFIQPWSLAQSVFEIFLPDSLIEECTWGYNSNTGAIGDTIGGIANPMIAFFALIMASLACAIQYKSYQAQQKEADIERFTNRYFRMLDIHLANLNDLKSDSENGEVFKEYYMYYAVIYKIVENLYSSIIDDDHLENHDKLVAFATNLESRGKKDVFLMKIAYGYFFYGLDFCLTGDRTKAECIILLEISTQIKTWIEVIISTTTKKKISEYYKGISDKELPDNQIIDFLMSAFSPKNERLGNYFRHLYHCVKYVVEHCPVEDEATRYDFVKMLRTQISDYGQIMLYYNSRSSVGKEWNKGKVTGSEIERMGYIARFRMVKNVPQYTIYVGEKIGKYYDGEIEIWKKQSKNFFEACPR